MSHSPLRSVRRTAAVALAVGLLSTGLATTADAARTTVSGQVTTAAGVAVPGVKVSIKVGRRQPVVATTDASGAFSANVRTGKAKIALVGPATPAPDLPPSWSFTRIRAGVTNNEVLNFSLPATSTVAVKVLRSKTNTPIPGSSIQQCLTSTSDADPHVVLAGSAAVSPSQNFVGAVTDSLGEVALTSFKDATLGRLCAGFVETGPATTIYSARGPIKDATADVAMNIYAPQVVPQAGTVTDSASLGAAGVKVALRSASGQVDSISEPTSASGDFLVDIAPGSVFARFSSRALGSANPPPPNIPRSFQATIDGIADGLSAWDVQLPATVTLTVEVINADGTPVKNAVIRPAAGGALDKADSAVLVAGQPDGQISQLIYGDGLSDTKGMTFARLFPDAALGAFTITKNVGGGARRVATVTAGTVLTSDTTITVVLPAA
ncbi:MAG: hypothetical protein ABI720_00145 [Actinomycetes bacterium]